MNRLTRLAPDCQILLRPHGWLSLLTAMLILVSGCTAEQPASLVAPLGMTAPVAEDADDPAIWVNQAAPERSLILATDKASAPGGALYVFNLDGSIIQVCPNLDRPNNVDVEYGFNLDGVPTDIAVVTERYQGRLRVFAINADGTGVHDVSSLEELKVFSGEAGERAAPMGIGLYRRPADGLVFAIVSRKEGPSQGYLWQYRLEADGAGKVRAVKVRELGAFSGSGEIEAVEVDDALGWVYYADEMAGLRKWHADPDHPEANRELAFFGKTGFQGDREGIALITFPDGKGYLLCTDQRPGGSVFHVFRREGEPGQPHAHMPLQQVETTADSTDGLAGTSAALGPRFPSGMVVAMNSSGRNFLLYSSDRLVPAAKPRD